MPTSTDPVTGYSRQRRVNAGLTQEALARAAGCSTPYVAKLDRQVDPHRVPQRSPGGRAVLPRIVAVLEEIERGVAMTTTTMNAKATALMPDVPPDQRELFGQLVGTAQAARVNGALLRSIADRLAASQIFPPRVQGKVERLVGDAMADADWIAEHLDEAVETIRADAQRTHDREAEHAA